jgi:hypothetical protein
MHRLVRHAVVIACFALCYPASATDTPASEADVVFTGEDHGDQAGSAVANAGDVNGDGRGDLLVGADNDDAGNIQAGQAYLILGRDGGWPPILGLDQSDASFPGEGLNDFAGTSVAGAGDVDGDGLDDILVGAFKNGEAATQAGQTYLILGRETGWARNTPLDSADASFQGEGSGDWSGYDVAVVADVDGDGLDDLLIGAHGNEETGAMAGQTYLILGRASGWTPDTSLSAAEASLLGEAEGDQSGQAVAGAGDVNGDGLGDLLVGAPINAEAGHEAGQAYLVLGRDSGWALDTSLAGADASFLGEEDSAWAGSAVAGVGDVDGDGLDDILVGAPHANDGGAQSGKAYLWFGRSTGWAPDTPLSDADASFVGEDSADNAGGALAGAGDVDGDGYADFLIGAGGNSEAGNDAGQAYLFLGKAAGWSRDLDLAGADESFLGDNPEDNLGAAVALTGDVDGDGFAEVLVGAYGHDQLGSDTGQAYLFFCLDADDDGVTACDGDCEDTVPTAFPGAVEVCDGADSDCDGTLPADETDTDADGFWPCNGDCDDLDPLAHPGATELCDGVDNDCDDEIDEGTDVDDDGDGMTECDGDCDDADAAVYEGAAELCDGVDNDCNGEIDDVDADGDGHLDADCGGDDCDDADADVHPTAAEDCEDGVDNDCDGLVDVLDEECDAGDDDDSGGETDDDDSAGDDDDDTEGPGDDDSGDPGDEGGCGCDASGRGASPLVLLLLLWITARAGGWSRRAAHRPTSASSRGSDRG